MAAGTRSGRSEYRGSTSPCPRGTRRAKLHSARLLPCARSSSEQVVEGTHHIMAEGTGLEPYSPCQSLVRGQGGFQDVQACVDLSIHLPVAREAHEILAHPISAPSATHWAEIGVRRRPVSRSNEYDWFAAMSRGFLTSGGELFRFFLMRRRWPFSKPRATSNADRIYFLCTRCSALKSWYATLASRAREPTSWAMAIRIDLFTSDRNSPSNHLAWGSSTFTANVRERRHATDSSFRLLRV